MALYEFECRSCGERFELSLPMAQQPALKEEPPACPKCSSRQTRQLVSSFSCKPPSKY